jgi:hypothetical protein
MTFFFARHLEFIGRHCTDERGVYGIVSEAWTGEFRLRRVFNAFYDEGGNALLSEYFLLFPMVAAFDHQIT